MAKCRTCGVSNHIIAERSALQTHLEEAQACIDFLERDRSERWPKDQIDSYRPYQNRPRRPFT